MIDMNEFNIFENEFISLCDLLKKAGLCQTGGMAKAFISEGMVKVDGEIELKKRCKIRAGQRVVFEGQEIIVVNK